MECKELYLARRKKMLMRRSSEGEGVVEKKTEIKVEVLLQKFCFFSFGFLGEGRGFYTRSTFDCTVNFPIS